MWTGLTRNGGNRQLMSSWSVDSDHPSLFSPRRLTRCVVVSVCTFFFGDILTPLPSSISPPAPPHLCGSVLVYLLVPRGDIQRCQIKRDGGMVKPLFMDPADLVAAWKKAVASNPDMPATPTVKVRTPYQRTDRLVSEKVDTYYIRNGVFFRDVACDVGKDGLCLAVVESMTWFAPPRADWYVVPKRSDPENS